VPAGIEALLAKKILQPMEGNMNGNERLEALAKDLVRWQKLTDAKFSMGEWYEYQRFDDGAKEPHCRTTACACGLMKHLDWAIAEGFVVGKVDTDLMHDTALLSYKGGTGWEAVREFFEIEHSTASKLFGEEAYGYSASPRMVANRIRKFLAGKL
jgi:hypothetical protein